MLFELLFAPHQRDSAGETEALRESETCPRPEANLAAGSGASAAITPDFV